MHTRCMLASFLSLLSWHDDNKIQMYQAAEEVIFFPPILLEHILIFRFYAQVL